MGKNNEVRLSTNQDVKRNSFYNIWNLSYDCTMVVYD